MSSARASAQGSQTAPLRNVHLTCEVLPSFALTVCAISFFQSLNRAETRSFMSGVKTFDFTRSHPSQPADEHSPAVHSHFEPICFFIFSPAIFRADASVAPARSQIVRHSPSHFPSFGQTMPDSPHSSAFVSRPFSCAAATPRSSATIPPNCHVLMNPPDVPCSGFTTKGRERTFHQLKRVC